MCSASDFVIEEGILTKYTGPGGELVVPDGVKSISDYGGVFPDDVEFTSVSLPDSLEKNIWSWWLWPLNIKTAAYIVSPEHPSLTSVDGVLYNKDLTEILAYPLLKKGELLLPKTFQKVAAGILDEALGITAFRVDPEHGLMCDQDGILYTKDKKILIGCPAGMSGAVTLAVETEKINGRALVGCPYVTDYVVPPENAYFKSIDGVLYNKSGDQLIKFPEGREGEFTVPDHVRSFGQYAFNQAVGMTKLTIPASVKELSRDAFQNADNLKELIMPAAIYCGQAEEIETLEWVELTGEGSYYSQDGVIFARWSWADGAVNLVACPKARSIPYTVPDGVDGISGSAFQGCRKLPEIIFAGKIPTMPQNTFESCEALLRIPKSCLRVADKIPTAFATRTETFDRTDFQWIAVHQTAKAWKEAVEQYVLSLNKSEFFQGMLDIIAQLNKISKATGINIVEFVQTWSTELTGQQIRTLREILLLKKCSAAVNAMDTDPRLQPALNGEDALRQKPCSHPIEQLVRDNWVSSKLVRDIQRRVKAGVAYQDNGKVCDPDVLVFILASYAETMDDHARYPSLYKVAYVRAVRVPLADQVAAALDQKAFQDFLEAFAADDNGGYLPALDGSLLALGRYAAPAQIAKLISSMREWEKKGPNGRKAIIIARGGLMLSDTREAMLAVDKAGGLDYYASLRGTTAEEIRDTVLADFGLDEDGKKVCDLGNGRSVEFRLNPDLSLGLFDLTANKIVKSIPKKGADPERYAEVSADLSDMKKNAKAIAKARNDRLFRAFLDAEAFDASSWKRTYLKNPLLRQVASLLVWEQEGVTFTILNREIIANDESPVTLTDAPIRLAHPMEMNKALVESWQKYFAANGLKQMFQQIWEPVFDPETVREDRYRGCTVPVLTLSSQKKHGIGVDGLGAYSEGFELWLTDCKLEAEPSDWRYVPGVNDDFYYTLGKFTFTKYTRWTNHIVGWFDRYLIADKVKKDDVSVYNMLSGFSLAQITEFLKLATENNCTNVTALLLDYKNQNFADFDPMEEFSLEW